MPAFQLFGLDDAAFQPLFDLDDAELSILNARRVRASADFGYPCRVSLEEARAGEELLLLSFPHQLATGPYRASGPIYVRRGVRRRVLEAGAVPATVLRRLMSLRVYDHEDMMIAAEVVDGQAVAGALASILSAADAAYVHLHHAQRGCFSCLARRAMPFAV